MAVTGACADVFYLQSSDSEGSVWEPDFHRPVSKGEVVESVKAHLRDLVDAERVDEPVRPKNAFGI